MSKQHRLSLLASKKIVCKYLSYRLVIDKQAHWIHLPLIHTVLESRTEKIATDGLVDSGATATFIPKEIADAIDLVPSGAVEREQATGAGGKFPTIPVVLKRLTLVKNVSSFGEFVEIPALVPDQEGILPYVILGRDRVFKRFDITFQEKRRKFVFDRL